MREASSIYRHEAPELLEPPLNDNQHRLRSFIALQGVSWLPHQEPLAIWSDVKGRKIQAELIEVAKGQCRFRRDKKEFLYPLDQLNAEDRKRALAQQSLMRVIPLPEG